MVGAPRDGSRLGSRGDLSVATTPPRCPGCGTPARGDELADAPGGPASAECFALFGELLAASYADPGRRRVHQLVVDAYTVQHPGGTSPRQVRAVAICLMTLHLFLDEGVDPREGPVLHKRMVGSRIPFLRLEPPRLDDAVTVADVRGLDPSEYEQGVYAWAGAVWDAWARHHDIVRSWTRMLAEG